MNFRDVLLTPFLALFLHASAVVAQGSATQMTLFPVQVPIVVAQGTTSFTATLFPVQYPFVAPQGSTSSTATRTTLFPVQVPIVVAQGVISFSATTTTPSGLNNTQFSGEVTNTPLNNGLTVTPIYRNDGVLGGVEARLNGAGAVFPGGASNFSGSASFNNSTFTGSTVIPQSTRFRVTGDRATGIDLTRLPPGVGGLD